MVIGVLPIFAPFPVRIYGYFLVKQLQSPDRSRAFRLSLDGTIETTFGRFGNYDGQFRLGHDIAVGNDGAVYVVDAWGMRVQKFVEKRYLK